jgi:hypothetical protein
VAVAHTGYGRLKEVHSSLNNLDKPQSSLHDGTHKKLSNGTWLLSHAVYAKRELVNENVHVEDDGICVNGRYYLPQPVCPFLILPSFTPLAMHIVP